MSSVTAESVTTAAPEKRKSGLVSMFEHTKYVLGENKVTAFAFGLLVVILFAAIFGPYIVPYDPLASDTASGAEAAVGGALVRHRSARPRHLQPRHGRHPARYFHRRQPRSCWCS